MASILEREFSFCDRAQNNLTLSALCDQKQSAIFCDVIMKVCGREIFAHSNILAAASPYFNSFLRQDLPRQFSQRTPQVIEIQIDGSEPSVYFEEAVAAVVDFIYTGKMLINECNVSQICEIGRIMQMDNIVKFCSDFMEGRTDLNDTIQGRTEMQSFGGENKTLVECSTMTDSWAADSASMYQKHKVTPKVGDPEFHAKIKARQLVSVSCQIYPHLLPELAKDDARMQDQATSTDNRYFEMLHKLNKGATRGRKRKAKDIDQSEPEVHRYKLIHTESGDVILSAETGELIVPEQQMADQEQVTMLITEGIDESEVFPSAEQSQNLRVYAEDIMVLRDMEYDPTAKKEGNCEPCSTVTVIEHVDVGHNVEPDGTGAKISTTAADGDFPEDQFNSSENVDEDDDDDFTVSLTKLSPRRSRRVTKPSARLQEFQELQEIHVSQFKKIKQEIIEILPISDARVVEIVPIEQLERVGTTSKAYLEGVVEKSLVEHHSPLKQERVEQEEAAVRLLSLANEFVQKDQIQDDLEDDLDDDLDDDLEEHSDDMKHIQKSVPRLVWQAKSVRDELQRKSARKVMSNVSVVQIGPGKYQCDTCTFSTNRVRQMSAHIKLHKLENNTCYYCEKTFSTKEELGGHMSEHKGPVPFFCHVCSMRFKSRTLLNMHLPKHSDNKPFICHVCSMGFKWKHALKCHMITHSNKKEHLCDTCGYATAHKSQLKAHRKIHSGDMLKCHYPECQFLATKTQNMKYHLLTHTKEKPHQCEMCGQNFSLVKNLRRHLMLHSTDKKQNCVYCSFVSTRMDKLKEHQLKMHGVGTPPERRLRVTDQVKHLQNVSKTGRGWRGAAEVVEEPGVEDQEQVNSDQELVKAETELIKSSQEREDEPPLEVIVNDEMSSQTTNVGHNTSEANGEQTTLIEIIHEEGQPMHIIRNQTILMAHPVGHDGGEILEQMEGSMQDFVKFTSHVVDEGLVLAESVDNIEDVRQDLEAGQIVQGRATLREVLGAEGMVTTQVVNTDCLEIQGMDGEQVTYAELVEVPGTQIVEVEQVRGIVPSVSSVELQ